MEESKHLSILGITFEDAQDKVKLKKAFYKKSLQYHPDKNPLEGSDRFIELKNAFEYFKNLPFGRKREKEPPGTKRKASQYYPGPLSRDSEVDYESRFQWFYNESGFVHSKSYQRTNGASVQPLVNHMTGKTFNISLYIQLTLSEVYSGSIRTINFNRKVTCPYCDQWTHPYCVSCKGTRYCNETVTRRITIKPGTFEGDKIVLHGESHKCLTAQPGNVVIQIGECASLKCESHHIDSPYTVDSNVWMTESLWKVKDLVYIRMRYHFIVTKRITIDQSIGGFSFCFNNPDNKKKIVIEKLDKKILIPNTYLCMRGLGISARGHLFVHFIITNANILTSKQRKRWAALMIADHLDEKFLAGKKNVVYANNTDLFSVKILG